MDVADRSDGNGTALHSPSVMTSNAPVRADSASVPPAALLDEASLARAYDEHAPGMFRFLRRLDVPASAVDDAVQDVFLVAWRKRHDFAGRSSTRTWLYGIALRVARDHRHARNRRAHETPELDLPHHAPSPERASEQSEALRHLDAALSQLSEPLRESFVLIEIEQLTAPEVADLLSVPLNTVYSRLRLARQSVLSALRSTSTTSTTRTEVTP